jgi:ornithine--oxo-acid transaminase
MKNVHTEVSKLTDDQAIEMTEKYGSHNYHPLHINLVRGLGCYAYDGSGKKYIDCIGSYSAVANGHLSEYIVQTVKDQLEHLTLTSRAVYTSEMALFLKELCEYTEADMACPMNTGAEAVETAIKLARKWAYEVKGVPDEQAEIIVAHQNFHGRTVTIVSFSTEAGTKDHFGPYTPGFKVVPFGDIEAVKAAITPNTAAVLFEPVQAEGGILFPPKGFMKQVRDLCTKENVLLIWDEIQTGFCRTGKKFAWMHEDSKPDLMCVGKALGGGIMPVSAVVGTKEVMGVFHPGDHGSTFGGNPLASVIGIATIEEMNEKKLAENSKERGERMKAGFLALNYDCVEEVRGEGLLVGLEVKGGTDTAVLGKAFIDNGVLTKETRSRTFRFAPPLVISPEIVDEVVEKVGSALSTVSKQLVGA